MSDYFSTMKDADMPLLDRIEAALDRITNRQGLMRIPREATDIDVVVLDCGDEIKRLRAELAALKAGREVPVSITRCMVRLDGVWITPDAALAEIHRLRAELAALKAQPDPLAEMWRELSEYQPQADRDGHGESWARMCSERTEEAASAASLAALESAEAASAARAAAESAASESVASAASESAASWASAQSIAAIRKAKEAKP